jgi:hypothetical protein
MDVLRDCRWMFSLALSVWTTRRLGVRWGSPWIVPEPSWLPMMSATAYGELDPRLMRQRNTESGRLTWLESACEIEAVSQRSVQSNSVYHEAARRRLEKHDGTFASPATRTTKPTRSAVDIHLRTLRPAVMPARSPITRSPSRRTATPSVKILVRRNGDKRILESSSSHSANASSSNILCRLTSAEKSPINTSLRT